MGRVGDPASRSWSPVRLSGACGPAGAWSAAVRKDLNLNLSAVHENIHIRAYGQRFRNWFRVQASGSIGPMCFKSGAVACAPPIVRDESSRVFLGGALQQSPPLRRPSSMVGQFSLEVNRKHEAVVLRRLPSSSSKPAEMRAFYPGTDSRTGYVRITRDSPTSGTHTGQANSGQSVTKCPSTRQRVVPGPLSAYRPSRRGGGKS